ncbi:MAG: hypothetical protein ACK52I_26470 [Pseudomonadota bacterium]
MLKLTETKAAIEWVGQFDVRHQVLAIELLDAVSLVSNQELMSGLRDLLVDYAQATKVPVALYAEREVKKWNGIPNRLFKESRQLPRRAYGSGPQPVQPTRAYDPQIGSEGLIANLVTQMCRQLPKIFLNHPGPEKIRKEEVRTIALVTDFIGSGKRVTEYLDALWRLSSVKSWTSLGHVRFSIFSYAATESGRRAIERHPAGPFVNVVTACPTIDTEFDSHRATRIRELCIEYDPLDQDVVESLGYAGHGVLLAFEHGIPNNAPRILYKNRRRKINLWRALFPARVTSGIRNSFGRRSDHEEIRRRLKRLGQKRISEGSWVVSATKNGKKMALVLAALARGPRREDVVAARSGLTTLEVRVIVQKAMTFRWVDSRFRLTDRGYKQLSHARRMQVVAKIPKAKDILYYPKSLRASHPTI